MLQKTECGGLGELEYGGDGVRINLNDFIKVKLTDWGKEIYYHQHDDLNKCIEKRGGKLITPEMPQVDADGKTKFQLWYFIELYGKYIGLVKRNVIEPLDLEVINEQNND